jgi:catechol 2,3-dioxygenase-like lactoylglutathione lyase family enzyme
MLEHSSLIGFVGVTDLDQARQFYGETLGLPLRDESPFALVADAGGTMLRITAVDQPAAAPYTVLGWAVADIAAAVDELAARAASGSPGTTECSRTTGACGQRLAVRESPGSWTRTATTCP